MMFILPAKYINMEIKAMQSRMSATLIHFQEHRSDTRQSFCKVNLDGEYWFRGKDRTAMLIGAPFPVTVPLWGVLLGKTGRITGADGIPVNFGFEAGGPPTNLWTRIIKGSKVKRLSEASSSLLKYSLHILLCFYMHAGTGVLNSNHFPCTSSILHPYSKVHIHTQSFETWPGALRAHTP